MSISSNKLKEFIEQQGWTDYGIAPIQEVEAALKEHEGIFENWLKKGFQADMAYLEQMKEDRYHPKNKLPNVQSVVVLQAWYASPVKNDELKIKNTESKGLVARYAYGRDYHKILKKRLIKLSKWLKEQDGSIETYISVDSGPTVDRVLAEVAGLGFFGKNSLLIDPSKGSYFFIASLMTTTKLPVTKKRRMPSCGNCNKCMVACPTNAIVAPGVIDARRCISYLTIENKEGIPLELRSKLGDRLFGCDICQEVCPFNEGRAGMQEIRMSELMAESGVGDWLDLADILSIKTDEEYLERFAGTPIMRAKRRGLLRNACVVAGNIGGKSLVHILQKIIEQEEDEMLKEHAQWAVDQINSRK